MNEDYLWKVRCPESGYLIGECCCMYCFDEFELDSTYADEYSDLFDEFDVEDLEEDELNDDWEVEEII